MMVPSMKFSTINNARPCSGAEEHQLELSLWMREQGVDITFLVRDESILGDKAAAAGFPIRRVFTGGIRNLRSIPSIFRFLLREKPDILSVNREHTIYPVYCAYLLAAPFLAKRPRLVAVFHAPTGRRYPVLRLFDGVICTSRYTAAAFFRNNPFIGGKTAIIHYGIALFSANADVKADRNRPRRFFTDRGFPLIGMVGELWKNQEELIDASVRIREAFPGVTVAIIGGGHEAAYARLRERIRGLGLEENVILTGRIDRGRMPDIFHDLDISVSTHRNEGFGIVHIESMAAYTPVIAYNSGGIAEIVEKGGGVLVDGKTAEFSEAVIDLLGDDAKRIGLGREGRRVVEENFSVDIMGENHLAFYKKLLG
jgi:glycosyltransferase involved in cell wall biosynthesis